MLQKSQLGTSGGGGGGGGGGCGQQLHVSREYDEVKVTAVVVGSLV